MNETIRPMGLEVAIASVAAHESGANPTTAAHLLADV
jgi:hypothetical protein